MSLALGHISRTVAMFSGNVAIFQALLPIHCAKAGLLAWSTTSTGDQPWLYIKDSATIPNVKKLLERERNFGSRKAIDKRNDAVQQDTSSPVSTSQAEVTLIMSAILLRLCLSPPAAVMLDALPFDFDTPSILASELTRGLGRVEGGRLCMEGHGGGKVDGCARLPFMTCARRVQPFILAHSLLSRGW